MSPPAHQPDESSPQLEPLLVIGAGTMGRGIAQLGIQAGLSTRLVDTDPSQLDGAVRAIAGSLERRVARGTITAAERDSALQRLQPEADLTAAASGVRVVVESVPEKLELKVAVLCTALEHAPEVALLGSNTSSLSITELGEGLGAGQRTVGLHFFNPATAMELLEIVRGLHTTDATLGLAQQLAERLGKTAIVVRDGPGFATSRLGLVIGAEAVRMVEASVASVEDIDRAMELGYRHPMGPLKLSDLVGLDVRLAILEHLHRELGEQFRPPPLLRQMVRAGWLGKKTGRGFYRWTEKGPVPTDPREG